MKHLYESLIRIPFPSKTIRDKYAQKVDRTKVLGNVLLIQFCSGALVGKAMFARNDRNYWMIEFSWIALTAVHSCAKNLEDLFLSLMAECSPLELLADSIPNLPCLGTLRSYH